MSQLLVKKLFSYISHRPVVVVCIGTDIVGGDCLGPLVGRLLQESGVPIYVYGTLDSPVTALNVNEIGEFVRKMHRDSLIIAVDSAVGAKFEEGMITVSNSALQPGSADGKRLNFIGDVSVTAVTSSHAPGDREFSLVRLGFVYNLARQVSSLIEDCLRYSFYYIGDAAATKNAAKAD